MWLNMATFDPKWGHIWGPKWRALWGPFWTSVLEVPVTARGGYRTRYTVF